MVVWRVVEHDGLGHLEHQVATAREPGRLAGCPRGRRRTSSCWSWAARQVDGQRDAARRRRSARAPPRGTPRQHPAAERQDRAALLGQRDELVRPDEPARRVAPADERLDADTCARSRARRSAGSRRRARPRRRSRDSSVDSAWRATIAACIVGSKTAKRFLPAALAVYIATSALRRRSSACSVAAAGRRRCRCSPPTLRLLAVDRERDAQRVDRAGVATVDARRRGPASSIEQDRELVAAEPGGEVVRPDARPDALRDGRSAAGRRRRGRACR